MKKRTKRYALIVLMLLIGVVYCQPPGNMQLGPFNHFYICKLNSFDTFKITGNISEDVKVGGWINIMVSENPDLSFIKIEDSINNTADIIYFDEIIWDDESGNWLYNYDDKTKAKYFPETGCFRYQFNLFTCVDYGNCK